MKVAIDEPGRWERVLSVEVPAADLSADIDAVYRDLNARVAFPGFRKGKAPRHVIRARYGGSIDREVLERAVPRAYQRALEQQQLVPVSDPEFDQVVYTENEPLSFQAKVKVGPRVEPTGYKGMKLAMTVDPVNEADVEANLASLRERHADFVPVEREALDGDVAVIEYAPLDRDGNPAEKWTRDFPLLVGEGTLVPEFARAVAGARAGEEREAALPAREGDESGAPGQRFRLRVQEVREKRLPPIDDALAQRIEKTGRGESGHYASLDDLKDEIRRRLGLVEEAKARGRMVEVALAELLETNRFEAPDFLVDSLLESVQVPDDQVDPMIVGDRETKARKLRAELRPRAEERVRRSLLLSAIARAEHVHVERRDVDREIARIAAREGRSVDDVRAAIDRTDSMGGLRERILEDKVIAFIMDGAEVSRQEPGRIIKPGEATRGEA
jgi:trigger factor